MPYHVGEKGSYGCSGYPVVKDGTSEVMGCHDTEAAARNQITAINMSEAESSKKRLRSGVDGFEPASDKDSVLFPKSDYNDETGEWYNAKPIPETSAFQDEVETRNNISREIGKEEGMEIKEGDYVMGQTTEGIVHGRVEHIMWEGGVLGSPEGEYSLLSRPPQNPAMSVRIFEEEDEGYWEETAYSIGMMYQDAIKLPGLEGHTMEEETDNPNMEDVYAMAKAETYIPTAGMKAAARRAIKWKEDGKATGAGTPVGWGRARDIVAGRSMSLSVVKRMYSFFSRHEVDKKGKDFYNTSNPSNGRIMWDAWGGDAGFSWSRKIVKRNEDKALFADFGKDYTKTARLDNIFKAESVRVGQMVSWNSSGGTARGKVKRIIRNGSYKVPGTDVTVTGTPEDPAAVITLYRDGEPTDTIVAHKVKTLRAS